MKKILCSLFLAVVSVLAVNAQVDNYSLKLTSEGNVTFNAMPELDGISSYTVQFWMNVAEWNEGAVVYSRGDDFKAALGKENELIFIVGTQKLIATSKDLAAGKWAQLTFLANDNAARVLVNGVECGKNSAVMTIPASLSPFVIGGGLNGRIDEFRVWKAELAADYDYFQNNTLNKFAPQWDDLVAYYKFDQNLCENVVDYKFKHHGIFSENGAEREIVTDNSEFKYYIAAAYTDFSRFFDRAIDRDKYLLANDLIVLGISSSSSGHLSLPYPNNPGVLQNAEYLAEFGGRKGVLSLNGEGVGMVVGKNALTPTDQYTFQTWIYLEEWTEGAYIFRKETADGKNGFSIRLGKENESKPGTGQIVVRVNGHDYASMATNPFAMNQWVHFGVRTYSQDMQIERTFEFMFNGIAFFGANGQCGTEKESWLPAGVDDVDAVVGENLKAKLDDTAIWHMSRDRFAMQSDMESGLPMPDFDVVLTAGIMQKVNSFWNYDNAEDPGYDYYSYKHFLSIMRSAYENHRGFKIRMSVSGHEGWENTFADANKRKIIAQDLAEISKEFDGVDLDFEWTYSTAGWNNYGLLTEEIRKLLPEGKIFTVSPHYVTYAFPTKYMPNVDYFTFQIYGPAKNNFTWNTYLDAFRRFTGHGYPNDKILMSFATTTSRGYDANGKEIASAAPIGVRNNLLEGNYTPDMDSALDAQGLTRYFTGYNQSYERAKHARDNKLAGIFYWDMGNDVKTNHKYSLVKAASFAINSNVDTLVTKVDMNPGAVEMLPNENGKGCLRVYPNPVDNQLTIHLPSGESCQSLEVFNATGVCVLRNDNFEKILDVSAIHSGMYVLSVQTTSGKMYTNKFMKR